MKKRLLNIVWATNYNGIYLKFAEPVSEQERNKYEGIFAKAVEDVPPITFELVGEDLYEAINIGDREGSELEDAFSDEELQPIFDHVQAKLAELDGEQFDLALVYDHFSS